MSTGGIKDTYNSTNIVCKQKRQRNCLPDAHLGKACIPARACIVPVCKMLYDMPSLSVNEDIGRIHMYMHNTLQRLD